MVSISSWHKQMDDNLNSINPTLICVMLPDLNTVQVNHWLLDFAAASDGANKK